MNRYRTKTEMHCLGWNLGLVKRFGGICTGLIRRCLRERIKMDQGRTNIRKWRGKDKSGPLHISRKLVNSAVWHSLTLTLYPVFLLNSILTYFLCGPALYSGFLVAHTTF